LHPFSFVSSVLRTDHPTAQDARECYRLNIAEVFVTSSAFVEGEDAGARGSARSPPSQIVRNYTLPFIANLTFRAPVLESIPLSPAGALEGPWSPGGVGAVRAQLVRAGGQEAPVGGLAALQDGAQRERGTHTRHVPPTSSTHPLAAGGGGAEDWQMQVQRGAGGMGMEGAGSAAPPWSMGGQQQHAAAAARGQVSQAPALSPLELNLAFWVGVGGGEFLKTSSKGSFMDVQVTCDL
jgi:hypothetical protein